MTARTLTAREYVAAFTTWRDLSRGKLPRARVGDDRDAAGARFDDLVAGGCAAVLAAFPDDEKRAPGAYCTTFEAYLGERPAVARFDSRLFGHLWRCDDAPTEGGR